jgi:hypothetical protein
MMTPAVMTRTTRMTANILPARGAHRRIQALIAIGWTQSALEDLVDINVSDILHRDAITKDTADTVAALYAHLELTPAPDSPASRSARRLAARNGWAPPLAWDDIDNDPTPIAPEPHPDDVDEIAIALAVSGHVVRLTTPERRIVVAELVARGRTDGEIAPLAGCHRDHVARIRDALGLPAAYMAGERYAS